MCGIAGVVASNDRSEESLREVRRMLQELVRRGPDGIEAQAFGGVVLGHARLAIIDLQTGDQPQTDESGDVVVTVNGEIYNYVELRAELVARGHSFRTSSDIEVIPHLYREYGPAFVEHLRGMFAIALYDRSEETVILVRDRLGKKPIYFTETPHGFYFASEVKALMQVPGLALTIDQRALEDYFTYQYVPAPKSVFKEVSKLPAASMLVRRRGRNVVKEYWSPPTEVDASITEEEALDRLEELLDESVRIRLRSDVPLGAFLSAGIDSTLVVSRASRFTERLKTTTIAFDDRNDSEVELASRVAARFGTDHTVKQISTNVRDVVERVGHYLDEPLGDSSTIPSFMVSRAVREDVKVALSGDGGDESFGGYAWRYRQNVLFDRLRGRIPRPARGLIGWIARWYPKFDRLPKPVRLKWGLRNLSVTPEEAYFLDMSIFRPEDKASLYRPEFRSSLSGYSAKSVFDEHFAKREGDLLSRLLYVDLKTYLAEGVLAKVDRMSMANSLEVRSPLLDQQIVEYAARIPPELKLHGKTSKYLLRKLASRHVGDDVAAAPKSGFAPPLGRWIANDLAELFREVVVEAPHGIHLVLDSAVVRRMFDEHTAGVRNHARPLWLMLTFELWYRSFGARARFG